MVLRGSDINSMERKRRCQINVNVIATRGGGGG